MIVYDAALVPRLGRAVAQIEDHRQGTEKPMRTMPDFTPENANGGLWGIDNEKGGNPIAHALIRIIAMMRMDRALAKWCTEDGVDVMETRYAENTARYRGMVAMLEAQYGDDEVAEFLAVISRQMDAQDSLT